MEWGYTKSAILPNDYRLDETLQSCQLPPGSTRVDLHFNAKLK